MTKDEGRGRARGNHTFFRHALTVKTYSAVGQLLGEKFFDAQGALLATNGFAYGPGGEVTNAFNALGARTERHYTSTGQLKYQKNPDGSTNAWRYYLDGRPATNVLGNGAWWQTTYDDAHRRVTCVFHSAGGSPLATNTTEFDRRGNVVKTTDAGGFASTNLYDGLDRIKVAAGPAIVSTPPTNAPSPPGGGGGATTNQRLATNTYDASGQVLTVANALGEKTLTVSDALGRPLRVEICPAGGASPVRVTEMAYAPNHHSGTVWQGTGAGEIPITMFTDNDGRPVLAAGDYSFSADGQPAGNGLVGLDGVLAVSGLSGPVKVERR
jgi:YD repeat-containing protein